MPLKVQCHKLFFPWFFQDSNPYSYAKLFSHFHIKFRFCIHSRMFNESLRSLRSQAQRCFWQNHIVRLGDDWHRGVFKDLNMFAKGSRFLYFWVNFNVYKLIPLMNQTPQCHWRGWVFFLVLLCILNFRYRTNIIAKLKPFSKRF